MKLRIQSPCGPTRFLAGLAITLTSLEANPEERGVLTSLFGTFIEEGEKVLYSFYEYDTNGESEYTPSELGFVGEQEFLGDSRLHEFLLFFGYGLTDSMALEIEGGLYSDERLRRDPLDDSGLPAELQESGLGEVEAQLHYRLSEETARSPEYFGYTEVVFPFQTNKRLIGAQDWEVVQGFGLIKEYAFGTLLGRFSVGYEFGESELELAEYGFEYIRDLSDRARSVMALEGEDDEVSLIGELQFQMSDHARLKLNAGFGLTEKAADFSPEVGLLWKF